MRAAMPAVAAVLAVAACASTPDVEYTYYPVKSSVTATVVQTVACTPDQTALLTQNVPSLTATYTADYARPPFHFRPAAIEGAFGPLADTDASFSFTPDGRLKGINQSSTGQGEAIIKSAVGLATTLAALGGAAPGAPKGPVLAVCAVLKKAGGDKAATITYAGRVSFADVTTDPDGGFLEPVAASRALAGAVKAADPSRQPRIRIAAPKSGEPAGVRWTPPAGAPDGMAMLPLTPTANLNVAIAASGTTILDSNVVVSAPGAFALPIPRAALFGRQQLVLTLDESGAITQIDYGKNTGAAGAMNAASAIAQTQTPPTAAAQAAAIKGESDLIYQTKRHAACVTAPASCAAN